MSKTEKKQIRHVYTDAENLALGRELSQAITRARLLEDEFDKVKAGYKARESAASAEIGIASSKIEMGFELRDANCIVVYRPKDRMKDYYLEDDKTLSKVVLTEEMTQEDYQMDFVEAESKFDRREEIPLFQESGVSRGVLVVGRFGDNRIGLGRWYSALRIQVGDRRIQERLDSEQKSVVERADAVKLGALRARDWLVSTLGEKSAEGFFKPILDVVEQHKEREE